MSVEDDEFVINGPEPVVPVSDNTLGKEIFDALLTQPPNAHSMVDGFTGQILTNETLLRKSCELGEALRSIGYIPGTVVSICSENSLEFFIPVVASLFVGCIVAPINHTYTPAEIIHNLDISKPKIVFCSKEVSSKFIDIKKSSSHQPQIVIIDSDSGVRGTETLNVFLSKTLKGKVILPYKFQPLGGDASKLGAFILCSSGTTGLPKGVLISHRNIMVRTAQFKDPSQILGQDCIIGLLPFFHSYGLNIGLNAIISGIKIIVLRKFKDDTFLKVIQDYKIPLLPIAPPLAVFLEKSPMVLKYDMSSVEDIVCGAAPLSKNTEVVLRKRFKNLKRFRQGYGLTEATLAITAIATNENRPGSCGRVLPFVSCKVRDPETGKSLGPNQVGEICTKGPLIMMGYYNNEAATKETFTSDGWLRTGDLGYYDDEKYFYIVDRLKELIKYNGYQVAPAELEALLLGHPKVGDVGVIGLPDQTCGELPLAFIVKNDGQNVTEAELQEYVASKVSPQKKLRGGVIFVPEIPKNVSGKILRRVLRERAKDYKKKPKSKL